MREVDLLQEVVFPEDHLVDGGQLVVPTVQDPQEGVVRQDRLAEGLHPVVADVEDLEVLQPAEDGARQRGEVIAGQVE